jgi:hypothetical protein
MPQPVVPGSDALNPLALILDPAYLFGCCYFLVRFASWRLALWPISACAFQIRELDCPTFFLANLLIQALHLKLP